MKLSSGQLEEMKEAEDRHLEENYIEEKEEVKEIEMGKLG